ncbi:MAG: heme o synthase [Methylobacter sp.]|uniref:Protoheme IX farnesyltransferase n=1 Tax=Candidatus Methylobacter titanis TaxID=3053457 RepID=A0AA43Q581_9GAMM|nr:heme o synthase [Candidatus Methylobacter titanis]
MTSESPRPSWQSYLELCKPKVVALIVFTAMAGMLLAVPGIPPIGLFIYSSIGIALAAASAAAINHYIDRDADALMDRNKHRPLPKGELSSTDVIVFALTLGIISMVLLIFMVNVLTALLTFLSALGYAIIYTVYLKRMTPQNIVIAGAFGATPPLLGWCAMTGEVHPYAMLLFLIIFVWTPPHFWPLSIAKRKEFAKVGIPMLPVTHGVEYTRLHVLLYSLLLLIVTLLPYLTGMSGLIYLFAVVPLGLGFIYYAILMMRRKDDKTAMQTFFYSLMYLTGVFIALLVDHYFKLTL